MGVSRRAQTAKTSLLKKAIASRSNALSMGSARAMASIASGGSPFIIYMCRDSGGCCRNMGGYDKKGRDLMQRSRAVTYRRNSKSNRSPSRCSLNPMQRAAALLLGENLLTLPKAAKSNLLLRAKYVFSPQLCLEAALRCPFPSLLHRRGADLRRQPQHEALKLNKLADRRDRAHTDDFDLRARGARPRARHTPHHPWSGFPAPRSTSAPLGRAAPTHLAACARP